VSHPLGRVEPAVVGDQEAVVPGLVVEPAQPVETEDVHGGGVGVGEAEVGPDDRGACEVGGGRSGAGVDDVGAPFVGARGRDGSGTVEHEDGADPGPVVRVSDADAPRQVRDRGAA
jgi:hypothetical protein